jgi:electron transfer flavoprotein alpha subunit
MNVIVFLETSGEKKEEINRGLLTEGNRIASSVGGDLLALAIGECDETALTGFDLLTLYKVGGVNDYSGEVYAWAAAKVLAGIPFGLLLFAHTDRGAEIAPRAASYLHTVAVSDCVDIVVRENRLFYERLLYGGQFSQEVSYEMDLPQVASIKTEVLNIRPGGSGIPSSIAIAVDVPDDLPRTKVLDRIPPDYKTVDILYAKRIIGVGLGGEDTLPLVEELSHLLESSIGTTRPVVDDGYIPRERMIGQTGKTVAPDLYIALGLSGSPHHVAGIAQAKTILSVNADPKAPIFSVSDKGFKGDLHEILPRLIERIKQLRDDA